MSLITTEELAIATNIENLPGLAEFLMQISKLNQINEVFNRVEPYSGLEFLDILLETIGVEIEVDPDDLKKIPKKGAFIAVANHPFGGVDGIILLKLLAQVRPDIKLMVNFILTKIPNLEPYFVAVNPMEDLTNKPSLAGIKAVLNHLATGSPIGIFPAGEVSSFDRKSRRIIDREWHPVMGKIISKADVPILPVFFKGNNSLLFQVMSLIHPKLRLAKLPSEFLNKKGKKIQLKIGNLITPEEIKSFPNSSLALNYVRARTYALHLGIEPKRRFPFPKPKLSLLKKELPPIVPPIPVEQLIEEINRVEDCMVTSEGDYAIYNCPAYRIPEILKEIGRLREVTFREIGEGSGKEIDLDHYDIYYNHLFIWHKTENVVVGAYRLGFGKLILENRGYHAFYLSELFQIEDGFHEIMEAGIELGRAWIRKEFQAKPLPLFLLWRSLMTIIIQDPNLNYLYGPVSISNEYSEFSKALIVKFVKKYYFDENLARQVIPRTPFKPGKLNQTDLDILSGFGDNMKALDAIIADIEKIHKKIPVLLRQYFAINGKIAGFNIDTEFSDTLDGLLVLDVRDVPQSLIDKLKKSN